MHWFNLHAMTESDLRSFYRFVSSFEDEGEAAPEYVPADQEPPPLFIQWPAPPQ